MTGSPLPADLHVHSEWSWDADHGSMVDTCARAVEIGLPAVAFTEHVDHSVWRVATEGLDEDHLLVRMSDADGVITPPPLDVEGYLASIAECRERFPDLRIRTGVELGEPHRHEVAVLALLDRLRPDVVLGSVHTLRDERGAYAEPPGLWGGREPYAVVAAYLAEVTTMVAADAPFAVLAHVDYPLRSWPADAEPFDPSVVEEPWREALRLLASTGRALEVSTKVPLHERVLGWWREAGGEAISFGSDAHDPDRVGRGLREAADLATAYGFRPGRSLHDLWGR